MPTILPDSWRARRCLLRLFLSVAWVALAASGCADPRKLSPVPPPDVEPPQLLYKLERGDEIEIRVLDAEELNEKVLVRPDGKISVLLLDDVPAAGRTTDELARDIAHGLAAHYVHPTVTVTIRNFANLNVYVGGEVDRPGILPLEHRMTVGTAVISAGGLLDTGQPSNVIVVRDSGGHPLVYSVDLAGALAGTQPDLRLCPHDIVFVPKSKVAELDLFFEQYVRRVLPVDLSGTISYNYVRGAHP